MALHRRRAENRVRLRPRVAKLGEILDRIQTGLTVGDVAVGPEIVGGKARDTARTLRQEGGEERIRAHVSPGDTGPARNVGDQNTLGGVNAEGTGLSALQARVKLLEVFGFEPAIEDAGKAPIGTVDAPAQRHEHAAGVGRDTEMGAETEDVDLEEFADEIESEILDALKSIGCDTAKSVLEMDREDLIKRTNLSEEVVDEVISIFKSEFEN